MFEKTSLKKFDRKNNFLVKTLQASKESEKSRDKSRVAKNLLCGTLFGSPDLETLQLYRMATQMADSGPHPDLRSTKF